jgi:hypothetical protein
MCDRLLPSTRLPYRKRLVGRISDAVVDKYHTICEMMIHKGKLKWALLGVKSDAVPRVNCKFHLDCLVMKPGLRDEWLASNCCDTFINPVFVY